MLRRALRYAFTILSALSLLLCVAVCVLWVRSYVRADDVHWRQDYLTEGTAETRKAILSSVRGVLWGFVHRDTTPLGPGDRDDFLHLEANPFENRWDVVPWPDESDLPYGNRWWQRRGFYFDREQYRVFDTTASALEIGMPYWLLAAVTGACPVAWLSNNRRRRRRSRLSQCLSCGYDLRASPERCPECGTTVLNAV
jgi:hypothetical protein